VARRAANFAGGWRGATRTSANARRRRVHLLDAVDPELVLLLGAVGEPELIEQPGRGRVLGDGVGEEDLGVGVATGVGHRLGDLLGRLGEGLRYRQRLLVGVGRLVRLLVDAQHLAVDVPVLTAGLGQGRGLLRAALGLLVVAHVVLGEREVVPGLGEGRIELGGLGQPAHALVVVVLRPPQDAEVHVGQGVLGDQLDRRPELQRRLADVADGLEAQAVGHQQVAIARRHLGRLAQVLEAVLGAAGADQGVAAGGVAVGVGGGQLDDLAGDLGGLVEVLGGDQRVGVEDRAVGVRGVGLVVAQHDLDRGRRPTVAEEHLHVGLDDRELEVELLGLAVLGVGAVDIAGLGGGLGGGSRSAASASALGLGCLTLGLAPPLQAGAPVITAAAATSGRAGRVARAAAARRRRSVVTGGG
jgi:hypothetical protein